MLFPDNFTFVDFGRQQGDGGDESSLYVSGHSHREQIVLLLTA
jgi:hypothetical protein